MARSMLRPEGARPRRKRRCRGLLPEQLFALNAHHLRLTIIKAVQMRSDRLLLSLKSCFAHLKAFEAAVMPFASNAVT